MPLAVSRFRFCAFALVVAVAVPVVALAADGKKGTAFTEPPENDLSYQLQGEFVGPISVGEKKDQPLGLQLRAVGGENFEAVSFLGGLPGEDQHEPQPIKMIGRRSGDFLVLSGGPWALIVEKSSCQIIDRQGERIGRLERIHRVSPTLGAKPPGESIVLFDGTGTEQFTQAKTTEEALLAEGATIKPMLQDFDLHLEFRLPYMPHSAGQSRGNSGIYLMSRYECQILDSFAQDLMNNGCGAIYQFKAPELNMSFPPLTWQTYDVRFTAPRWSADGSKLKNARITIWLNGVKVQDNVDVPSQTGAGKPEEPVLLPTLLQNHNDPVRFRNVWVVDRGLLTTDPFPIASTPEERAEAAKPTFKKLPAKLEEKDEKETSETAAGEKTTEKDAPEKPSQEKPATEEVKPEPENKPAAVNEPVTVEPEEQAEVK